ncbi:oligosaccharide flippase family protein [Alkalimonas collagenimarina]|uniref:Oligosaccharide flippase family protein n=1 Tax=Alkalimonas collagenimarina TaxID=400390 RepID=A0ABT9GZ72_9GAMM|nr:oligosaccharide flippase family protein [Alkalimonas collagenimarina]MDP4536361.1 oligosaccharide flippase family protein [Alkalimonas collagenimarina]
MLRSLFKNAVSVLAEKGVIILMTFITTPILLNELGVTTYGVWILLINMVAWARMSNLGFGSAVTRTAAIYIERNNYSEMNSLFNSSLLLNGALGFIGIVIVSLPIFFPNILQLPESYLDEAAFILMCLCIKVLADFVLMSANSYFSAALKQNVVANISALSELGKGIGTIYLVLNGYGIMGMLFALLVTDFLAFIAKLLFLKKTYPDLRLGFSFISYQQIKDIFAFSKYILLANVALIVRKRIGVNVVSKFVGVASVATFNIAQQLVLHCENIITIISQVASPAATRVLNREDKSQQAKYISMMSRLNLFSTVVVLMPLLVFSDAFVRIWLGEEFIAVAFFIKLFSLMLISKFIFYSAQSVMIAKAKHQLLPVIHIFGAVLTVTLSIVLAKLYGVIGVVSGLVIASLCTELLFFTPILLRELAEQRKHFMKVLLTAILATVLLLVLAEQLDLALYINGWIKLLIAVAVFSICNLLLFWLISFNKHERASHVQIFRDKRKAS